MSFFSIPEAKSFIEAEFTKNALPAIMDYIKIPNLSRLYDTNWATNGLLEKAADHIKSWILAQNIAGISIDYIQEPGRTPLLFIEVKGTSEKSPTVLLYGHFDKQPHLDGWEEDLGPTLPVIRDGKLYGRGGADDGYSSFAAILAIKACQAQKVEHPRCVIFLEADEESGSQDLPHYLLSLKEKIGSPSLIICLDSGAGDYERLWLTTSLRGVLSGELRIRVMTEEVHSGDCSGVIPSTFRILRQLLDRVDCVETGYVNEKFQVNIPPDRYAEAFRYAGISGKDLYPRMPIYKSTKPVTEEVFQLVLNRIWRAQLTVTGIEGLPELSKAGNVVKPWTAVKLSLRVPPTLDVEKALQDFKELLEKNPPYDAEVIFKGGAGSGWNAPTMSKGLVEVLNQASLGFYEKEFESQGEGGSIPFMKILGDLFPKAEFAVVGVLGPKSNAHAPNEFLHLDMTKKLIGCMSKLLADSPILYSS